MGWYGRAHFCESREPYLPDDQAGLHPIHQSWASCIGNGQCHFIADRLAGVTGGRDCFAVRHRPAVLSSIERDHDDRAGVSAGVAGEFSALLHRYGVRQFPDADRDARGASTVVGDQGLMVRHPLADENVPEESCGSSGKPTASNH